MRTGVIHWLTAVRIQPVSAGSRMPISDIRLVTTHTAAFVPKYDFSKAALAHSFSSRMTIRAQASYVYRWFGRTLARKTKFPLTSVQNNGAFATGSDRIPLSGTGLVNHSVRAGAAIASSPFIYVIWLSFSHFHSIKFIVRSFLISAYAAESHSRTEVQDWL